MSLKSIFYYFETIMDNMDVIVTVKPNLRKYSWLPEPYHHLRHLNIFFRGYVSLLSRKTNLKQKMISDV